MLKLLLLFLFYSSLAQHVSLTRAKRIGFYTIRGLSLV
ncbi:hypothetical protein GLYMA_16G044133v4 [Glycine max]|nr:hypothetical protein GLYMA_16G044133v4 [Glycine max]KAH1149945.1 hypothetical protein GYH30_044121 [Glycine max]